MEKQVLETRETSPAVQIDAGNPAALLQLAIEKGGSIEQLEKLMDLQERWQKQLARKAFFVALAAFQAEVPDLQKTKKGHNYFYAPLGSITKAIAPTMTAHGLSYRWEISEDKGISVTCIVSHDEGHSEKSSMSGEADKTGSKNDIQARGSAVTYLQRYTLISALGLSTADVDNDAQDYGKKPEKQLNKTAEVNIVSEIRSWKTPTEFKVNWPDVKAKIISMSGESTAQTIYTTVVTPALKKAQNGTTSKSN